MKCTPWLAVPFGAAVVLIGSSAFAGHNGGYGNNGEDEEQETPFDEARLFFELNHTDGDLGIHALIDGDAWKRLKIEDPNDVRMLDVAVRGRLRRQGLTEIFFESAEPSFDELAPEKFFRRFPQGVYDIEGMTLDGVELESEVQLSHVLPAPAGNIQISGVNAAENCDVDPLPTVSTPVMITWDPVMQSHPDLGQSGAVTVEHYQLVLEREEPSLLVFSVDLPPDVTQFEFPADFLALGDEFKFEIIVRAANGNQTAIESCFEVE